jgi:hypothetical protein
MLQSSLQSAVTYDTIELFMTCLPHINDPKLRHPFMPPYHIFVSVDRLTRTDT